MFWSSEWLVQWENVDHLIPSVFLLLLLLSRFSRVWLCDPIDGSPPGSLVLRILQARTVERVAISFSSVWKWKVKVKSLSRVQPWATTWTAAHQAPLSMGFSRQEYWSGVLLPSLMFILVEANSWMYFFGGSFLENKSEGVVRHSVSENNRSLNLC